MKILLINGDLIGLRMVTWKKKKLRLVVGITGRL